MATSITDEGVGGIVNWDRVAVPDMSPFIAMAEVLSYQCCRNAGYSDDHMSYIQLLLAAHFYTIRDPQIEREGVGRGVINTFTFRPGKTGLQQTRYGMQAMVLDVAGGLAALDNSLAEVKKPLPVTTNAGGAVVGVVSLGTPPTVGP